MFNLHNLFSDETSMLTLSTQQTDKNL